MTVIVGILCSDGAVVASDSAATFGTGAGHPTIGQQPARKVLVIDDAIIFATSGAVGLSQSLCAAVKEASKTKLPQDPIAAKNALEMALRAKQVPALQAAAAARAAGLGALVSMNAECQTIIAAPVMGMARLYQFDGAGQGEAASDDLPCVAIGSGQAIADPFLAHLRQTFWPKRLPTVSEGIFAAVWAVQHVIDTNPGGVGGEVQIATIERNKKGGLGARLHAKEDVDEHRQSIEAAVEHLASFKREQTQAEPTDAELPKPPTAQPK